MDIQKRLQERLNLPSWKVHAVLELINDGCTIPFIARYRKEKTGNMSDIELREFETQYQKLLLMQEREKTIVSSLKEQGVFNDALAKSIEEANSLAELEDIYLPYRPKRKTKASEAKRKGLLPLANLIFFQKECHDFPSYIKSFVHGEILTEEDALSGAKDIIAEQLSENAFLRKKLRFAIFREGYLISKEKKENNEYEMYANFKEKISQIPLHRILAVNRGEKEGFLSVRIEVKNEELLQKIQKYVVKTSLYSEILKEAIKDSYQRLLFPSLSLEIRNYLTDKAEESALKVFQKNARVLLMEPPLKGKIVMGFDPAFRTGCKIAVVDPNGEVLDVDVLYPTEPQKKIEESKSILLQIIKKYHVDIIALGNGTASRESEAFLRPILNELNLPYLIVDEAGASVYSASEIGSKEFPSLDVSKRSAISLARRLQDPLCELVKIPSKSLGVGQYQHDMDQKRLKESLNTVVMDCVNAVGVDLLSASKSLLQYVSGINDSLADEIIEYRKLHSFTNRKDLLKVKKLGPKTFQQCAGFLRIQNGTEPLDSTRIHPEQYEIADRILSFFHLEHKDIGSDKFIRCLENVSMKEMEEKFTVDENTLTDIIEELKRPSREIRGLPKHANLRQDIHDISDLRVGMILEGTVRNVMDFGAFVDIGVHQDGLIHITELSSQYVKHPLCILNLHDVVKVKVIHVDVSKKRISLSLKDVEQ